MSTGAILIHSRLMNYHKVSKTTIFNLKMILTVFHVYHTPSQALIPVVNIK